LVEFAGVVDALHCSTEIEAAVAITGGSLAPDRRIGINVGDVVVEGADIFGDGINLASRLED
jgi:adenylate cyclase